MDMRSSRDWPRALLLLVLVLMSSGCEAIGNIFQAGVWVGVIVVVLVLGVIGFLVAKIRR
ncbi:MAG: hypothetical protein H0W08_00545 [Acidobacteria bacterium]|nr:hypothetical protein [Acidobacteriota bacterium]